ncbi:hypothetical protein VSH64_37725 [Amycolatopsis rhabdoformis]|uniref:Type VII secretion-associated protein n=1 Tax=Amycolatopsis rhabdoformis TaxID=1448059 RepID=A0ABZ1I2D1_9PSEU|nr:hypothetical protein [Amycolatopsis rhabdoformis]WSE28529.1 hypothetical protein VSH64_37725 [Amycolatopsis rhabdoformis]
MSWQEELRRLDSDLAAGRIGHAEHRHRREELLAEASGGGAASPVASPLRAGGEGPAPVAEPGPAAGTWNAEPVTWNQPAPGWAPTVPAAPMAPMTPMAPAAPSTPNTWASANPAHHPSPDQTQPVWHPVQQQVTEPAEHAAPPAEEKKPQRPPRSSLTRKPRWDPKKGEKSFATAPSPADVNPTGYLPVTGDTGDPAQATPELRRLWEEAPPRKKKPTWLFLSLGVLIVLALVVGGIWYIGNRPNQSDDADTVSPPPVPTASGDPSTSLEDKLPALAGTPNPDNSTMSLDKAVELKVVSQADADLMKSASAQELVYRAYADTTHTDNGTILLAVPTPSPAQAAQLVKGLKQNLTAGGFGSTPLGPAPTDLLYSGSSPAGRVLAFWYTSGPVAIGIGVSEPLTDDAVVLRSRIEQIRTKVAAALPAR